MTTIPLTWMIAIILYWLIAVANLFLVFYNTDIRAHDEEVLRAYPRCPNFMIVISKIVFAITWPLPVTYGLYLMIFRHKKS